MTRGAAALRLFIGLVLAATAAGKMLDVRGFADVLRTYEALPVSWLFPLALLIALAELSLSVWLFSGHRAAAAALASLAMHVGYAGWSAVSLLRGLTLSNCGCFGVFFARPLGWGTVAEDLAMAAASALLFSLSREPS